MLSCLSIQGKKKCYKGAEKKKEHLKKESIYFNQFIYEETWDNNVRKKKIRQNYFIWTTITLHTIHMLHFGPDFLHLSLIFFINKDSR